MSTVGNILFPGRLGYRQVAAAAGIDRWVGRYIHTYIHKAVGSRRRSYTSSRGARAPVIKMMMVIIPVNPW